MELAQILPDGGISATWLFGIMTAVIGYLIMAKLNRFEKTLEAHGEEIQEIKLNQVEAKTKMSNVHDRLNHMDEEFEKLLQRFDATIKAARG